VAKRRGRGFQGRSAAYGTSGRGIRRRDGVSGKEAWLNGREGVSFEEGAWPTGRVGGLPEMGRDLPDEWAGHPEKGTWPTRKCPGRVRRVFVRFQVEGRGYCHVHLLRLRTLRTHPFSRGHAHTSPYGEAIRPGMAKEVSARPRMAQNGLTVGQIWPTMITSQDDMI